MPKTKGPKLVKVWCKKCGNEFRIDLLDGGDWPECCGVQCDAEPPSEWPRVQRRLYQDRIDNPNDYIVEFFVTQRYTVHQKAAFPHAAQDAVQQCLDANTEYPFWPPGQLHYDEDYKNVKVGVAIEEETDDS